MRVNIIKASDGSFVLEVIGVEAGPRLETFDTLEGVAERVKAIFATRNPGEVAVA